MSVSPHHDFPLHLGSIELSEPLIQAPSGSTYRGYCKSSEQRVIVKTAQEAHPQKFLGLQREIQILESERVSEELFIVEKGMFQSIQWVARSWVEGKTLREHQQQIWQTLKPSNQLESTIFQEACTLICQICYPLSQLHQYGLVHADLKPENILITPSGKAIIIDFEQTCRFYSTPNKMALEADFSIGGSPGYTAPEQIRCIALDARTDLYALGCIFYELLTGRLPFPNSHSQLRDHLSLPPPPLAPEVENLPQPINQLVQSLLAKSMTDRPGYASDVVQQLLPHTSRQFQKEFREMAPAASNYLYRPTFTGRRDLIRALRPFLDPESTQGGAVLIRGESGMGKTFFANELARLFQGRFFHVVRGETVPTTEMMGHQSQFSTNTQPFQAFLKEVVEQCKLDGKEKTQQWLGDQYAVLSLYEPKVKELGKLLEAPDSIWGIDLPTEVLLQEVKHAFAEMLNHYARTTKLVLILDDLQWANELTLSILEWLLPEKLQAMNVLLIGFYRTEEVPSILQALNENKDVVSFQLERLTQNEVSQQLESMLALSQFPPPLVKLLYHESEGNPFYVAEYLRMAVAENWFARTHEGHWQFQPPPQASASSNFQLETPNSIQELLVRRIQALPEAGQIFLHVGSILGRVFEVNLVSVILSQDDVSQDEKDWPPVLEELFQAGILEESQPGRVSFTHDKLRECCTNMISPAQNEHYHQAAATVMESNFKESSDPSLLAPLAHHWLEGGKPETAMGYFGQAGFHARQSLVPKESITYFEKAIAIAQKRKLSHPNQMATWLAGVARSYEDLGDLQQSEHQAIRALAEYGEPIPSSRGEWATLILKQSWRQLNFRLFSSKASQTSNAAPPVTHWKDASLLVSFLSRRYYFSNNMLGMIGSAILAVNLLDRSRATDSGAAHSFLGLVLGSCTLRKLAQYYLDKAETYALTAEGPLGYNDQTFTFVAVGHYLTGVGQWQESQRVIDYLGRLINKDLDPKNYAQYQSTLGALKFFQGQLQETQTIFNEMIEVGQTWNNRQHLAWGLFMSGRSALLKGHPQRAKTYLIQAKTHLEEVQDYASMLICLGLLIQTHMTLEEWESAEEVANHTLELQNQSLPMALTVIDGCLGPLQFYLHRWQTAKLTGHSQELPQWQAKTKNAFGFVKKLALLFPILKPTCLIYQALVLRCSDKEQQAVRILKKSLHWSQHFQMPYPQAQAQTLLAQSSCVESQKCGEYAVQAEHLYQQMGCRPFSFFTHETSSS